MNKIILIILLLYPLQLLQGSIVVLNGLTHTHQVEHGKVYKGKIEIQNAGNHPQSVKIFLQDYSYQSNGVVEYNAPNTNHKTNSNWLKLNTNLVTLGVKEKAEIHYELTIPEWLAEPGSYWSVIMVEPVDDINPIKEESGINIRSIVRYAIQIITDYESDQGKPELKFNSVNLEQKDSKKTLKVAVSNAGNLYCKTMASIEIYDRTNGEKVGIYRSDLISLLPNTSKTINIDLSQVPPNKYNAVLIAVDEEENAFALNVELEIKDE